MLLPFTHFVLSELYWSLKLASSMRTGNEHRALLSVLLS